MYNVEFFTVSKKQNSTARPAGAGTVLPCRANTSFDILAPSVALNTGTYPGNYNYCYIPEFGRYYYCTFRFDVSTGLWWADCQVDAMASWRTQIGALSGYVLRSAAEWDGTIIDTMYPYTADTANESQAIAGASYDLEPLNGSYVVGIASEGPVKYYVYTYDGVRVLLNYVTGTQYAADVAGAFAWLQPDTKAQVNGMQYLISLVWLPFNLYNSTTYCGTAPAQIRVGAAAIPNGAGDTPNSAGKPLLVYYRTFTRQHILHHHPFRDTRGVWMDAGAAVYTLYAPGFGLISLDPSMVANSDRIESRATVDLTMGTSVLDVVGVHAGTEPDYMASRINGNVGISISLSHTIRAGIGAGDVISNILPVAAAAASQNYVLAAMSAAGSVQSLTNKMIPRSNIMGGNPSVCRLVGTETMYYQWLIPVDDDVTDKGRPLCKMRRLDTLPGYQLVGDIHVEIPCTEQEKEAITATVTGGYYFE